MAVSIHPVGAGGLDAFLDFPEALYEGDPVWVPPLRLWERRRVLARLAPERLWLLAARVGGQLAGTISVMRDPGDEVAWFGYFECRRDPAVAAALLDAAARVASGWGARVLRGPRNLSRFEFVGLTVQGFDRLPPMLQAHHPPWYRELIEAAGLVKHHDVYAYETPLVEADGSPRALPEKLSGRAAGCSIPGLVVRRARRRRLTRDLELAHEVLNRSYVSVPDVSPMPRETFMGLGRAMAVLADLELIQLAFVGERAVGFAVCLPEINEALVRCRGRLSPRAIAGLVSGWRGIRTAAIKLIGVDPELRGSGLHAVMIQAIVLGAQRAGYTRMDGSVIDERNRPMRGVVEGLGMAIYRVYRFYQREV